MRIMRVRMSRRCAGHMTTILRERMKKMACLKVIVVLLAVFATSSIAGPVPLVLWHGMGDSCCFPFSMGNLMKMVSEKVPGIYLRSIQIGDSIEADVLNGFFKNVNDQVDMVCKNLTLDQNLKNGFNVIGFSQGGQFWRTVVQRCGDKLKVHNLISVGGQHQGVFGFPRCPGTNLTLCDEVRKLLNIGAYEKYIQSILVQAEYWQDPFNLAEYRQKCVFLPDINQENSVNADYKARLSNISNLVLVKFLEDTMVQPRDSEWFGFYKEGQDKEVYTLFESKIWTEDSLGLQHLNSTGRLHFLGAPFDHLQFTADWFNENLIPFINVDQSEAHRPIPSPQPHPFAHLWNDRSVL